MKRRERHPLARAVDEVRNALATARKRRVGVHWLVTYGPGYNYLHETDITGYSLWGDRDRAKRFDDWDSRRIVELLRTGNGMMRAPIKDARRVKVTVYRRTR